LFSSRLTALQVGMPRDVVEHKMRSESAHPIALDLDPDLPLPPGINAPDDEAAASLNTPTRTRFAPSARAVTTTAVRKQRKRLHWEPLAKERLARAGGATGTIWGEAAAALMDGGPEGSGDDDDFDDPDFEQLFTQEIGPGAANAASALRGGDSAGSAKKSIVYLVDLKRGRNVGIALGRLKVPFPVIHNALSSLSYVVDGTELSYDDLTLLEAQLPTPEEVAQARTKFMRFILIDANLYIGWLAQVRAYHGDKSRLGEAEKFFLAMADIPKPRARAAALAYQRVFDAKISDAVSWKLWLGVRDYQNILQASSVALLSAACAEVRASPRLRKVLEAVLRLGNKLNAPSEDSNSRTPGAQPVVTAITFGSLLKLTHTKAFDGRTTVLHYLVGTLQVGTSVHWYVFITIFLCSGSATGQMHYDWLRTCHPPQRRLD
jgi:hypothetical protein